MLRKLLFAFIGCGVVFLGRLSAAETPTITISKSDTIELALASFAGPDGAAIAKIVQNDLTLSGYFTLTDASRAAMIVSGNASGGGLQGKVSDHSGNNALLRSYSGNARQTAHAFANDIIETLTGNRGMAGSKIAFIATKSGRKEVYTAGYDGGGIVQVTRDGNISAAPALSADGNRLAYTAYLKGYADIYTIDLASGRRERIVKFPGTNSGAAWAPNGGQIACTVSRDGNPELYVVSSGGGGARRLTRTRGVESSPSWSPDGSEIVYSSDESGSPQLYRISAGGGRGRLLSTGYGYCTRPAWSPDGKRIAFTIRQGGFQIALLDLNSGAVRVVASEGRDPAWGPDSRHLLYTQGGALLLLDIQTGRKIRLIDNLGSISEPAWSR